MIKIEQARKEQAETIARLIMEAMNHACCQWFAGPGHTLQEFHRLMTRLVRHEASQYSYRNTLVAVADNGEVIAACVSYDGALLHRLRLPFIEGCLSAFNRDYSDMADETAAGELYVDSLCVDRPFRGRGIASRLLHATAEKGKAMNLPTGLLVDTGNPKAESLYRREGFVYLNDSEWGSHRMHHLQKPLA